MASIYKLPSRNMTGGTHVTLARSGLPIVWVVVSVAKRLYVRTQYLDC